jgi:type I restriction enzyme, R subunit
MPSTSPSQGTPISFSDRNTKDVFGEYIDVYDLTRAVKDGATVPVYFESRLYGAPQRLAAQASDILAHWDVRSAEMQKFISSPGKALIVGATREICARLYEEIVALRPSWADDAIDKGAIKVVYSGTAQDQGIVAKYVRREAQNKTIQQRLRDPDDELQRASSRP